MIHPIQRLFLIPLLKLFWIKNVEGIENLPKDGRFIVTPNHQSFLDDWIPSTIIVPFLDKELHMYVNNTYFKNRIFRWYLYNSKCIPVETRKIESRKKINGEALKKALYYLSINEPICIYPEGHRSLDGELQEAKPGAAKLALEARVPILPFGIVGTRDILPKGQKFPKIKRIVNVKIGKPIYFDKYYRKKDNNEIKEKITREIMQGIGKLVGKRYKY